MKANQVRYCSEVNLDTQYARYIYGVAPARDTVRLTCPGIDNSTVYTVPFQDVCAIVHNCPAEPYKSADDYKVGEWAKAHQRVLDTAREIFGMVIPFGFDVIIRNPAGSGSADEVVANWLSEDYSRLKAIMERIRDKDEYAVQVFYDPKVVGEQISQQNEDIKSIKLQVPGMSPGIAYLYRQKLENTIKCEMGRLADKWFKEFYLRIKPYCQEVIVEKIKRLDSGKLGLLNLSCLVSKGNVESLGAELEEIQNLEGFSVHFSGPWPPYSFVNRPSIAVK